MLNMPSGGKAEIKNLTDLAIYVFNSALPPKVTFQIINTLLWSLGQKSYVHIFKGLSGCKIITQNECF